MKKLLIANRGEIARRVIRTAHAMGIATVAVYADADRQALHVREASSAVALGGNASVDTYLRIDKLLAAARSSGADAVHPGYGFLSENAEFAQAVVDAGLIWVGPPAAAIRALGSKSAAKALALENGVPCLPGYSGADQSDAAFGTEAERLGYPLMVKAVAGGGGRGMRLVHAASELLPALASARSEALGSFGDGDLLIERALLQPRHVEVQIFADAQGHCVHMGERDCSVQRRHQKIIEEAPSPAVSPELRAELGRCAVALAQSAHYVGAGTVEFLLESGAVAPVGGGAMGPRFFLMEMNTRLQVEHPVTEALTGLDLVEWQLRVARGEALPLDQDGVRLNGHAVEVRLCAEDANHLPQTGTVRHFQAPTAGGVRTDHALENGLVVSPHYDAMLGKWIAHAPTRDEALNRLALALNDTQVLGVQSNRAFLAACVSHPVFRAGQALIPFLQTHGDELRERLSVVAGSAAERVAAMAVLYARALPAEALPCPWAKPARLALNGRVVAFDVLEVGGGRVQLLGAELESAAHVAAMADGMPGRSVVLEGQVWRTHAVTTSPGRWHVQIHGGGAQNALELWVDDVSAHPPGGAGSARIINDLRAPFNGKLIGVKAVVGQTVAKGAALMVVESMKLEHSLAAPRDAVVAEVLVQEGQQLAPGQLMVRFEAAK